MKYLKCYTTLFVFLITVALVQTAHAYDFSPEEIGLTYGHGSGVNPWIQVDLIQRLGASPSFLPSFLNASYLDLGLATNKWKRSGSRAYHISANFMVRSHDMATPIGKVFTEIGFGPHLFSNPGDIDRLGTAFEFNSFVGGGLHLSKQWLTLIKVRHISNGGITKGNAGTNLFLLQFNYKFGSKDP